MVFGLAWPTFAAEKPILYLDRSAAQSVLVKITLLQTQLAAGAAVLDALQSEVTALEEEVRINKNLVVTLEANIALHLKKEAVMEAEIVRLRDDLADMRFWSTIRTYVEIAGVAVLSGIFIYAGGN